MDYLTKLPDVYTIPDQEASTVSEILEQHWNSRYGIPLQLHSDQGRNFNSAVCKRLCSFAVIFVCLFRKPPDALLAPEETAGQMEEMHPLVREKNQMASEKVKIQFDTAFWKVPKSETSQSKPTGTI
ncbi:hypothetical protein TNCV_1618661 [Trichonephila clavipes]|nr:hypothetical protein TNCV_1618661 [Trichonephila clavipes]